MSGREGECAAKQFTCLVFSRSHVFPEFQGTQEFSRCPACLGYLDFFENPVLLGTPRIFICPVWDIMFFRTFRVPTNLSDVPSIFRMSRRDSECPAEIPNVQPKFRMLEAWNDRKVLPSFTFLGTSKLIYVSSDNLKIHVNPKENINKTKVISQSMIKNPYFSYGFLRIVYLLVIVCFVHECDSHSLTKLA